MLPIPIFHDTPCRTVNALVCEYIRAICIRTHVCVCVYIRGKGKNVGGEHHGVLSRVVRRRGPMIGRRHPSHAHVRVRYAGKGVTVLTGSMHPHEREREKEGLEVIRFPFTPLFVYLGADH